VEVNSKMKTWKIITSLVLVACIAVGGTIASVYALSWGIQTQTPHTPGSVVADSIMAPSQTNDPVTQTNLQTPTLYIPQTRMATSGYRSGWGWGGCMSGWGYATGYQTTGIATAPITISQAIDIATTYVASLNNADLKVTQVEEYTNNFYIVVSEKSTENGAFELLINKATGIVTPEPGPNMMWNTKYTFGNRFCNWIQSTTTTPTVNADQAKADAQQYLNNYLIGTNVGDVTAFYGHYTIEVLNNASPYGMLSVNSFTGQIWYHTWHGAFVQEQTVS